ncbi:MAG: hypothetical protein H7172_12390 [Ferruginibacter sp.]|nr:hypothetical protein [Rhodoferax sp.]
MHRDSIVVTPRDNSLTAQERDATTDDYWAELSRRIARRLPPRHAVATVKTLETAIG